MFQSSVPVTAEAFHDRAAEPAHARPGREVRLDETAAIENLLLWLDRPES